jgi:hypothetical protein
VTHQDIIIALCIGILAAGIGWGIGLWVCHW